MCEGGSAGGGRERAESLAMAGSGGREAPPRGATAASRLPVPGWGALGVRVGGWGCTAGLPPGAAGPAGKRRPFVATGAAGLAVAGARAASMVTAAVGLRQSPRLTHAGRAPSLPTAGPAASPAAASAP